MSRSLHRIILLALGATLALVLVAAPALAQEDPYTGDQGQTQDDGGQGNQVIGSTATRGDTGNAGGGSLALTGVESLTLAAVGGALIIGGAAFVLAGRRKESASV